MPEHRRKFLDTFVLSLAEALAHVVKDDGIAYLGLTIAPWVVWRREPVGDLVLDTKSSHFLAGEVRLVVEDNGVW